jgi:hypothetical protein
MRSIIAVVVMATSAWGVAVAADGDVYTTLELEHREFPQESKVPDRPDRQSAAALTVEFFREWNRGDQLLSGVFFGRVDSDDDERTHADIRELSFVHAARDYEVRLGVRKVFWGVTESRHLVDVINQTDFVEDIDNEDKLGQPMINLAWISDFGTWDAFWLPYFRERTFPGEDGRPAFPFEITEDAARYESHQEQSHQDFALRWRHTVGALDVGVSWFKGTAREPRLLPCVRQGSGFEGTATQANCDLDSAVTDPALSGFEPLDRILIALAQQAGLAPTDAEVQAAFFDAVQIIPHYDQIEQYSIDAQWIIGATALKLEALRRERGERWANALVTGFEHTLYGVFDSAIDVGLLSEFIYDRREAEGQDLFDREVFAGTRLSFNDVAGTALLAGGVRSLDETTISYLVEAERRFGASVKVSLQARLVSNVPDDAPAQASSALLDYEDTISAIVQLYF